MENDLGDRQKIRCALGRKSYIVLHKYGESMKQEERRRRPGRGRERVRKSGTPEWIVQPLVVLAISTPASFAGPPTLKRDGPKQTRSPTAETVLLE